MGPTHAHRHTQTPEHSMQRPRRTAKYALISKTSHHRTESPNITRTPTHRHILLIINPSIHPSIYPPGHSSISASQDRGHPEWEGGPPLDHASHPSQTHFSSGWEYMKNLGHSADLHFPACFFFLCRLGLENGKKLTHFLRNKKAPSYVLPRLRVPRL